MILHVTTEAEWAMQCNNEYFVAASLSTEGFIHACTEEQLAGVLKRYFEGQEDLIILMVDETKLSSQIKFEKGLTDECSRIFSGPLSALQIVSVNNLS